MVSKKVPPPVVRIRQDKAKRWRWTLIASNGKIQADCGYSYSSKSQCIRAVRMVRRAFATAVVDAALHEHELPGGAEADA